MGFEVSVVMSIFNGERYLQEAIDSILNQTFKDFEFIIINDGSTDKTKKIVQSYNDNRIILIEQANTGLAIALNNGIKHSKGSFIARMDADDIALPERLEKQIGFLNSNPDYILVGTNAHIIDKNGDYVYSSDLPLSWEKIESRFPLSSFYHSSVMFRKESFYKSGGYYEKISRYSFEDSILWNSIRHFGKLANLEQPLIKYRLVPNAATSKSGKESKEVCRILMDIVRDNELSAENEIRLLKIRKKMDIKEKTRIYHLHIAKKYLWNNFNPEKARKNLRKAIRLDPFKLYPYCLFVVSYLSREIISLIYNKRK